MTEPPWMQYLTARDRQGRRGRGSLNQRVGGRRGDAVKGEPALPALAADGPFSAAC